MQGLQGRKLDGFPDTHEEVQAVHVDGEGGDARGPERFLDRIGGAVKIGLLRAHKADFATLGGDADPRRRIRLCGNAGEPPGGRESVSDLYVNARFHGRGDGGCVQHLGPVFRHFQGGAVGHAGNGTGGGNLLGVCRHNAGYVGPDLEGVCPQRGRVQGGAVIRAAAAERTDPSEGVAADEARRHDDRGVRGGDGRPDPPVRLRQVILHDEFPGIDPLGRDAFAFEFPGEDAGGKELTKGDFLLGRGGFHRGEQAHYFRGGFGLLGAREQAPHDGQVPVHQRGFPLQVAVCASKQPVRTAADGRTDEHHPAAVEGVAHNVQHAGHVGRVRNRRTTEFQNAEAHRCLDSLKFSKVRNLFVTLSRMTKVLGIFGFLQFGWADILDIGMVALLIYLLLRSIRGDSTVLNIVLVLSLLLVGQAIASALNMRMMTVLLSALLDVGVLAIIIIFQPEIRHLLNRVAMQTGISRRTGDLFNRLLGIKEERLGSRSVEELVEAVRAMSAEKTGALIVIQHKSSMDEFMDTGDRFDAEINRRLIMNIFFKNSPLHDGAMIIVGNRIAAARCQLPMTNRTDIPAHYGMRHRAAIGLSEDTDADVIVVSEESGGVRFVRNGEAKEVESIQELRELLGSALSTEKEKDKEE